MKTLWIAVLCLTVAVAVGVGLRLALPPVLVTVAHRQLSRRLTPPIKLKTVRPALLDYRVTVQGLAIGQPDGFGNDLLLDLPDARVTLVPRSLLRSPLTIDEVVITDSTLHLVRDEDGKLNVACLLRAAEAHPKPAKTSKPAPVHIRKIIVRNLTVRYTDCALAAAPVAVRIARIDAVITDVHLGPARSQEPSLSGHAEVTAHVSQPGYADAPLGIVARFGNLDPDQPIPAATIAMRLAGLELQPLQAVVPRGTSQIVGGDVLDVNVDIAMAAEALHGVVAIITPAGASLLVTVGGTPRQPLMANGAIPGLLADRAGEAGLNTLRNVAGTGEQLGRTAFSSAAAAGTGAGKMLTGIAAGLFKSAVNVSKGNLSEAGGNLLDTSSATLPDTADMVANTAARLWAGARKTGAAAAGNDRAQLWRADTQQRWARSWELACENLPQEPFPVPASALPTPKETAVIGDR